METPGAFPDGEWDCIRRMLAIEEQDHSPLPFLGQSSLMLGEVDGSIGIQSTCYSTSESGRNESMFYSFDADNSSLHYNSQESSHSSNCSDHSVFIANPTDTSFYFGYPDNVLANSTYTFKDFWMMNEKNPGSFVPLLIDIVMEEDVSLDEDETSDRSENSDHSQVEPLFLTPKQSQLKRKPDLQELQVPVGDETNINTSGDPKKKPCVSKDLQRRRMKNTWSKKNQKLDRINGNDAEETNLGSDGHGSSSYTCTSEEDNTNQENSEGATTSSSKLPPAALNLNGKTRASRGSATDPQSLYARKRRERINERLRILQNLVPNGTKVDISTMLEEALRYVKFLQLQIKLLSSDDLWMYAPIAYNGLDIGLDLSKKISQPL